MPNAIYSSTFHCCELCAELAGAPSRFSSLYGTVLKTRIVAESAHFVVMPSLGQLGDAHLMIVSRGHETAVSNLTPDARQDLFLLLSHTRSWLQAKFGGHHIVFENGDPKGTGRMNCSITHLHVHLVATRRTLSSIARHLHRFSPEQLSSLDAVADIADAYSLLQVDGIGLQLIRRKLPSQTLRKLIALEIGMSNWDWREVGTENQLSAVAHIAISDLAISNGVSPA